MATFFFGDSLTEGQIEKGAYSYVSHLMLENAGIRNHGRSGTTFDEYSIYPVDGMSLVSLVSRFQRLRSLQTAERIVLEFGINDIASWAAGGVTLSKIHISVAKALDLIRQVNKSAEIVFLRLSNSETLLEGYFESQLEYLKEYMQGYVTPYKSRRMLVDAYLDIFAPLEKKGYKVVDMVKEEQVPMFFDNLLKDNLHPNNKMYRQIAENIKDYVI